VPKRLAIILGASPTGLAAVRGLGGQGIRVRVADFNRDRPAFHSRFCEGEPITGSTVEQILERVLEATADERDPPIVIPTSDVMVLGLANNQQRVAKKLTTYQAIESGLATCVTDKAEFYQQCLNAGVSTAKTAFPKTGDQLLALANEFQFPMLLKPVFGHLWRERLQGKKLLVASSRNELNRIVDCFADDVGGLMAQELIPGPEENIWVGGVYRGHEGQHDCCFVGQKTRQYPPNFGSASYAQSIYNAEIEELSWRFLDAIDYRGICGTEFKLDRRDGKYKIIEVNPRPTLWFHLVTAAGMNLFEFAFRDLSGERLADPVTAQRQGVRWCFQDKDVLTWGHHVRRFNLWPLLTTFSPVNHGAIASLSDPMPSLKILFYYLRRLQERMFSGK
jgi:predicted ATP-grasp superfamily ATP-dependent carboligase